MLWFLLPEYERPIYGCDVFGKWSRILLSTSSNQKGWHWKLQNILEVNFRFIWKNIFKCDVNIIDSPSASNRLQYLNSQDN